ncbi:MAG TPA: ExsB family transcriptional regulator [Planctomycetota bacterium]|jgi:GMP synthase (glutamine-hydrolysing)|nr:ExsB family transcriptional regulator [Planctomycetota bacterium]OQC21825.1 MAG: GMP synthase (glutamine-hydrolyzing) [Planctomycetes bacterium ADurb.Bin069]NMD36510.1 ExsB family transcriptional regulator [Planctomycetota bacterium]HNR98224.1 ExsB family transcriptional regulator [Planctomycetota bacterium]HNU24907.1 ExsB family transcriptional regulator [Planctomycetota bacterium]
MPLKEITLAEINPTAFIDAKVRELAETVGDGAAVNALSGGVDSNTVTMLGHRALGARLKSYFIDNGFMREGEPDRVVAFFNARGVPVEKVDAREEFFAALRGKADPEEKRQAISEAFYKRVFGRLVARSGARFLLQGTILTDVEETVAGIKRQHNILAQLGIDTQAAYGYKVLEPLVELRKPAVRAVCKALGLPREMYNRPPFPGPALAARVIGEATPERIALVRIATRIVEEELEGTDTFQCLAILHEDQVTGIRDGKREFGRQIEVRCWDSEDTVTAAPTELPFATLKRLAERITREVPGVVSVTYNIASKPPSTVEAV